MFAASDDIAAETVDRSTATWLVHQTRDSHGTVTGPYAVTRRWLQALGSKWTQTAEALGAGHVNVAQARVIVEALAALPEDLGDDLVVEGGGVPGRASRSVRAAGSCGTSGVVFSSTWPPEVADEAEYQRLLADESRAQAATRLDLRPSR